MALLRVPISGRRLKRADYFGLEGAIQEQLQGWQARALSMMDKVILVRSVLSSIPVYFLSHTWVPKSYPLKLEQLFHQFIWGSHQECQGMHLLTQEVLYQPVKDGGLGIQSLVVQREALTTRHVMRFLLYSDSIQSSLMRAKYDPWTRPNEIRPPQSCSDMSKEICGHTRGL